MNVTYNFPAFNSSNGISLEIYICGCCIKPKCENCHNQELWNFNYGKKINYEDLNSFIIKSDKLIDNFVIMGGEPLCQIKELKKLLKFIKKYNKLIWLYTSFELNQIPKEIIALCDYIKTGKYDNTQLTNDNIQYGIQLASANQNIHKIKED